MFNFGTKIKSSAQLNQVSRGIRRVFMWQAAGMTVCGLVALGIASVEPLANIVTKSLPLLIVALIAPFFLGTFIFRNALNLSYKYSTLVLFYFSYWMLTGITMSLFFRIFTPESVLYCAGLAIGLFTIMAVYGYFTKSNLDSVGAIMGVSLWALIFVSIVNIFYRSQALSYVIAYFGVLIFIGLVAYYTQKIKDDFIAIGDDEDLTRRTVISGALFLGISLMNIFIYLLRLFGKRR